MATRLDDEFAILKNSNRDIPARQQTLRSLIEWSYGLLSAPERTLLHRLAIFSGGCSLTAVDFVCGFDPLDGRSVMETLSSLVEKSQVVAEQDRPRVRYRLLQSIHEFALEKLRAGGEYECMAGRHAQWFAQFAEDAAAMASSVPRASLLESMFGEIDNLNAALRWSLGPGQRFDHASSIISGLEHYWFDSGLSRDGLRSIDETLAAAATLERPVVARLYLARATLSAGQTRLESLARARNLFESLGDRYGIAKTLCSLATTLRQIGDHAGSAAAGADAIAHFHSAGATKTAHYATTLGFVALALVELGRVDEARTLFAEEEVLMESLGDPVRAAMGQVNHAEAEFALGNPAQALRLVETRARVAHTFGIGLVQRAFHRCREPQCRSVQSRPPKPVPGVSRGEDRTHAVAAHAVPQLCRHRTAASRDGCGLRAERFRRGLPAGIRRRSIRSGAGSA